MLTTLIAFFSGVLLAPAIRPLFRPVFIEMIRGGLVLTDEVKRMSSTLGESVEDAKAEAGAERAQRLADLEAEREAAAESPVEAESAPPAAKKNPAKQTSKPTGASD